MPPTIGGVTIDPQGQTLTVSITPAAKVYTDQSGMTPASFPATVTTRTSYYVSAAQQFAISVKNAQGTEIADHYGNPLVLDIQQGVMEGIAPILDRPGPEEGSQSGTYGTSVSVATLNRERMTKQAALSISPGGAWCWFNSPTVIDHQGSQNNRYLGWCASDGSIIVASVNLTTGAVAQFNLHSGFANTGVSTPTNDHASPAIVVRPDGRIIVFYAQQGASPIYYRISTNPEDVSAFGAEQTMTGVGASATYPHPHYIGSRLFLFYTSSPQGRVVYSDDNGATWSAPQLWISTAPNPGMYWAMRDNGAGRLDYTLSMHPNDSGSGYAALSSMYHGYFDGTSFRATDGTVIGTLAGLAAVANVNVYTQAGGIPVASHTKVYDYTTNGLCWAWDVTVDSANNPVAVFASYPLAAVGETYTTQPAHFTDHRYNYYRWNGSAWVGAQITPAGTKLGDDYSGFPEYQYSGGVAVSQVDPTVVFLSRQVAPSQQFEIERWVTTDGYGASWSSSPVTFESTAKQSRPMTPHSPTPGSPEVVWMNGAYFNYADFTVAVQMSAPPALAQTRTSLAVRPSGAGLTDILVAPALAVSPALLLPLAADVNDLSGNGVRVDSRVAPPVFTSGRYGDRKALSFDGTLQCLHTRAQPFTTGAVVTFFGWAKRTNHTNGHTLFGSDDNGGLNTNTGLRVNSGGQSVQFWANFAASAGAGSATWTNAWPGDGQWVHWALIVDQTGNTVELYINGVSKGQVSYSTPWGSTANFLEVGHYANFRAVSPANPWLGAQALFGYKAAALTATQIGAMAGAVSGSQNGNPALTSILTQLKNAGVVGVDNSTVGTVPSSRKDLANAAIKVLSETIDMGSCQGLSTLATGEVTAMLLGLQAGDVVKGLAFNLTMNTVTISLFKVGLFDLAGNLLASSADQSGTINSSSMKQIAFSAPYTVLTSGAYYVALLAVYSAGTVQVRRGDTSSAIQIALDSGSFRAVKQTGQTDLPSPASWSAGNNASAFYHIAAYS